MKLYLAMRGFEDGSADDQDVIGVYEELIQAEAGCFRDIVRTNGGVAYVQVMKLNEDSEVLR